MKSLNIICTIILLITLIIGVIKVDWLVIMMACLGLIGSIGGIIINEK